MKLTFDEQLVRQLLDDSKNTNEWSPLYGDSKTAKPGLWIVGDQGVYLMSNSKTGVKHPDSKPGETRSLVAYADQCNPEGDFNTWRENKRASFGGDDGCDFLEARFIEAALSVAKKGKVALNVTPTQISVPSR